MPYVLAAHFPKKCVTNRLTFDNIWLVDAVLSGAEGLTHLFGVAGCEQNNLIDDPGFPKSMIG